MQFGGTVTRKTVLPSFLSQPLSTSPQALFQRAYAKAKLPPGSGSIRKRICIEKMAEEFYLSRPYLSAKFKQETGRTLTDFILSEKTEEAKRLIRYTDKSLSVISSYLGFSSQSHFSRVFRRYAGSNPGDYVEKYRK